MHFNSSALRGNPIGMGLPQVSADDGVVSFSINQLAAGVARSINFWPVTQPVSGLAPMCEAG